jgi:hypothetical protein
MNNKLDFLSEVLDFEEDNKSNLFSFFKSSFQDNKWIFLFNGDNETIVDFNINLSDGTSLTSKKHYKKLNTLKHWIVESLYEDNTYMNGNKTIKSKLYAILNLFDYINCSDNNYDFAKYGFEILDSDYWISLITTYAANNEVSEKFNTEKYILAFYNKENETNYTKLELLSNDELKNLRDFFKKSKISVHTLIPNMLVKRNSFPKLLQENKQNLYREYDSYFRNSEETIMSDITLGNYLKSLKILLSMSSNNKNNYSLPNYKHLEKALNSDYSTVSRKRFETYPSQHIFKILEKAIEFHYSSGEKIINEYIESVKNNKKINNIRFDKGDPQSFFMKVRNNESQYHLLKVYYGVVQFVVGALMARRQTELLNLNVSNCLDESEKFLIFNRAKNTKGLFGIRGVYKLPIDTLAVDMIKNLQKLHSACNSKGFLFNMPNASTNIIPASNDRDQYNNHLDTFFDYIEAPLIDNKRLYIRQHQLRRFFAMSFFWGSGFGSLDTLRWFLGHTDVKHVYAYITESVSGDVLNSVKSQYIAENIDKYDDLLSLIKSKYHTQNLDLLDTNSLMEYINEMLEQNLIEIEPDFLIDNEQNKYEIIVKIKEK